HYCKPPIHVCRMGQRSIENLRISSAQDELQVVATAELQHPCPAHVEFTLDEWYAELVRLGQGQQCFGHSLGSLSFPAIGYREARSAFAWRKPSGGKSNPSGNLCSLAV